MHTQAWPVFDPRLATATEVTIAVQVDGKVRDRLVVPAGTSKPELERLALASAKVKAALDGARPTKIIAVPDRLVSLVTK